MFLYAKAFTDFELFCSETWDASQLTLEDLKGSGITDYTCGDNKLRTISLSKAVFEWFGGDRNEANYLNPHGTYTGQTFAAYDFATNPDETLTVIVDGTDVDITLGTAISNANGASIAISNVLCPVSTMCVTELTQGSDNADVLVLTSHLSTGTSSTITIKSTSGPNAKALFGTGTSVAGDNTRKTNIETQYGIISDWDVTHVKSMKKLFQLNLQITTGVLSFNSDLSKWTTTRVTNLAQMFDEENGSPFSQFNSMLTNFDTSKVTTMHAMFRNTKYNQDLAHFDTSNVIDLSYMFFGTTEFNQDLDWDTQKVK